MSRPRSALLLTALLLPIAWLTVSAGLQERALDGARDWRIPIKGYDPRDPLRGQYVRFSYGWAQAGDPRLCLNRDCSLCLSDSAGTVVATAVPKGQSCPFRVDIAASNIEVIPGLTGDRNVWFGSRIFVSEATAPEIETQLRKGPMVVVAALTSDGRLVNRRIEPAG
ncbi:MAG: GDYXXLXY domain-containing protein [Sandaracinobacter sp.]